MKILITGICGFVGSSVARWFRENVSGSEIFGLDNLARAGVVRNLASLQARNCRVFHGDVRQRSDLAILPPVDWIIDAAANPSVLGALTGVPHPGKWLSIILSARSTCSRPVVR
jgi:CDP-paratose 2-epimerase